MDSEIFLHLFVRNLKYGFEQALVNAVKMLKGAFSFVMLTSRGELSASRTPTASGPCAWESCNGNYVLASETCALDLVEAEFVRELDPGEIVIIGEDGLKSIRPDPQNRPAPSAFLNSSISPGPTAPFSAKTSTSPERPTAGAGPGSAGGRPTW
jgi:amidophosphoribosyltransferase